MPCKAVEEEYLNDEFAAGRKTEADNFRKEVNFGAFKSIFS